MIKKLNALAGEASESDLISTIRESANKIWLAGLGAFAKAQEEGGKMFEALVREGENVQKSATRTAQEAMTDVKAKAAGTWDKLEQVFEDRVARALQSLSVPTKRDVDALSRRVAELTEVAEKLSAAMSKPRARRKAAGAARRSARK